MSTRTRTELGLAIREIVYVLEQTQAVLDMTILRAKGGVQVPLSVQNGSLEATLISFRALDEFITSAGKRNDDIKASDFGYAGKGFLTADERNGIHKYLAHLSWHRVGAVKAWKFPEMLAQAKAEMLDFFTHVKHGLPPLSDEERGQLEYAIAFCSKPFS